MMNQFLFQIYRILVPKPVRTRILKKNLRKKILEYYFSLPRNEVNEEQREVLKYLENNPLTIFPYPFSDNYSPDKIEVHHDTSSGMHFVIQDGRKLFFRRNWGKKRIRRAFADLSREQDHDSPHRYLSDDFTLGENDILADIGAAEGNFSLSLIEKVKKIYLVEYDREWINALKHTFEPWKEKVVIIEKYVSGRDDEKHISLNTLLKNYPDITFLKIDVDGSEKQLLDGASLVLSSGVSLKIALCTYHRNDDEKDFTYILREKGFIVKPSGGYMIHFYDKKMKAPYLRRGLIRAVR